MKRRTFAQSMLALSAAPLLAHPTRASAATEPSSPPLMGGAITDVPGIKVGHHTLTRRPTGCTIIICKDGAVGGVDVRGSAPGTWETDLLDPTNVVQQVQAILLSGVSVSGGSAYGLEAATGVMRYLEQRKLGFKLRAGVVPIVSAAILMDLVWAILPFVRMPRPDTKLASPQPQAQSERATWGQEREQPLVRSSGPPVR
jgi:L-aminopeptidase/D-esterase-like protein